MKRIEAQDVAAYVWGIGMTVFTLWLLFSLYIPAVISLYTSMGFGFNFTLALIALTLFVMVIWVFLGYGASIAFAGIGFILGAITEGIIALRNYYKRA